MTQASSISASLEQVHTATPLVHCITNAVTIEACANAVLAIGGSPIMSDEPQDVEDIVSICGALVLNIGTLNERSIEGMKRAGARAAELGLPIILDPVGAGASALRTRTASMLLDELPISLVKGNMSELKALVGAAGTTKGVDVNPADMVSEEAVEEAAAFVQSFAEKAGCVVAATGPIDIVADANRAFAVFNGTPLQGRITGCGCRLAAMCGAYAACVDDQLEAALAAVVHMGVAGEVAQRSLREGEGTGTFSVRLMDALSLMQPDALAAKARVKEVSAWR